MAGGVQGYNVVLFCCLFSFCNNKILDLDGYTHTWTFLLLCYGKLVNALISAGKTAGIMVDTKENPINIEDLQDFQNTLIESYTEASNEYKVQIDKVNKARNIKKLMDW